MIHPVFKLLISHPAMLAEHASAYAELAQAEATEAAGALRRRALFAAAAAGSALIGLSSATVAGLLAASLPAPSMPAPVLLWALPGAWLALAAGLAWRARADRARLSFAQLRDQWREDLQLLKTAEDA